MPRVHGQLVAFHFARLAAFRWNNEQLAVRTHQHSAPGLHPHDPPAVGCEPGKGVAHPVVGSPHHGSRLPALPAVKRHSIQVVLHLGFFGVVRPLRPWSRVVGVTGLRADEDDFLPVRTPRRIALDVLGEVRSRQTVHLLRLAIVNDDDAAGGVEGLQELVVTVVAHENVFVQHRRDVPAVGG